MFTRRMILRVALLMFLLGLSELVHLWTKHRAAPITPEMFGAVGDGITDDALALSRACQVLQQAGHGQLLLSGTYRIGRGNPGNHRVAALELLGGDVYEIIFTSGAELVMDNLDPATGNGDELGGIYFAGPINQLVLRNPRVRWQTRPNARSQGDGIMLRGYPGDEGPTIRKCRIEHPYVENTPQAHIILIGVSDPEIVSAQVAYGHGDGCHFNACRRPVISGGLLAEGIGDDALGLVTYYGPTAQPMYAGNPDRMPFSLPALTEWSNAEARVDRVECRNGQANACRINGALNATIGTIHAQNTQNALQLDVTEANGDTFKWTVAASRGCQVGSVTAQGATFAVLALAQNVDQQAPNASAFLDMDVVIDQVTARNTVGGVSILVRDVHGVRVNKHDVDGAVQLLQS